MPPTYPSTASSSSSGNLKDEIRRVVLHAIVNYNGDISQIRKALGVRRLQDALRDFLPEIPYYTFFDALALSSKAKELLDKETRADGKKSQAHAVEPIRNIQRRVMIESLTKFPLHPEEAARSLGLGIHEFQMLRHQLKIRWKEHAPPDSETQNEPATPIKFRSSGFKITIDKEAASMEKGGTNLTFSRSSKVHRGARVITLRLFDVKNPHLYTLLAYGYPVKDTKNLALRGCLIGTELKRRGLLRPLLDVFFTLLPNINQTYSYLCIPVVNALLTNEYGFKPKKGTIANAWLARDRDLADGRRLLIAKDEKTEHWIHEHMPHGDRANYFVQIGDEPADKLAFTPLYLGSVLYHRAASRLGLYSSSSVEAVPEPKQTGGLFSLCPMVIIPLGMSYTVPLNLETVSNLIGTVGPSFLGALHAVSWGAVAAVIAGAVTINVSPELNKDTALELQDFFRQTNQRLEILFKADKDSKSASSPLSDEHLRDNDSISSPVDFNALFAVMKRWNSAYAAGRGVFGLAEQPLHITEGVGGLGDAAFLQEALKALAGSATTLEASLDTFGASDVHRALYKEFVFATKAFEELQAIAGRQALTQPLTVRSMIPLFEKWKSKAADRRGLYFDEFLQMFHRFGHHIYTFTVAWTLHVLSHSGLSQLENWQQLEAQVYTYTIHGFYFDLRHGFAWGQAERIGFGKDIEQRALEAHPEQIMTLFRWAQELGIPVNESLLLTLGPVRESFRDRYQAALSQETGKQPLSEAEQCVLNVTRSSLRSIMESERPVSLTFFAMHLARVLSILIPAYERLEYLFVEPTHNYSVDIHSLLALELCENLTSYKEQILANRTPQEQAKLKEEIQQLVALIHRLGGAAERKIYRALSLIHDAGKGIAEKDARYYTLSHQDIGADVVLPELAPYLSFLFDKKSWETLQTLIRHHQSLTYCAQRDLSGSRGESAARELLEEARLNVVQLELLYVFSLMDHFAVSLERLSESYEIWWYLRSHLFHLAMDILTLGKLGRLYHSSWRRREAQKIKNNLLASLPADSELRAEIDTFFKSFGNTSLISLPEATIENLLRLFTRTKKEGVLVVVECLKTPFASAAEGRGVFHVFIAYPKDRLGILNEVTAVFAAEGISIESSDINTAIDGRALDLFRVLYGGSYLESAKLTASLRELDEKKSTPIEYVRKEEVKPFKVAVESGFRRRRTQVRMEKSGSETVMELNTTDRVGMLFTVTSIFVAANVSVRKAFVQTKTFEAADIFCISVNGKPLEEALRNRISPLLRELLDKDAVGVEDIAQAMLQVAPSASSSASSVTSSVSSPAYYIESSVELEGEEERFLLDCILVDSVKNLEMDRFVLLFPSLPLQMALVSAGKSDWEDAAVGLALDGDAEPCTAKLGSSSAASEAAIKEKLRIIITQVREEKRRIINKVTQVGESLPWYNKVVYHPLLFMQNMLNILPLVELEDIQVHILNKRELMRIRQDIRGFWYLDDEKKVHIYVRQGEKPEAIVLHEMGALSGIEHAINLKLEKVDIFGGKGTDLVKAFNASLTLPQRAALSRVRKKYSINKLKGIEAIIDMWAYIQHLRRAHERTGWQGNTEFHKPGIEQQADNSLRRRFSNKKFLLCLRPY